MKNKKNIYFIVLSLSVFIVFIVFFNFFKVDKTRSKIESDLALHTEKQTNSQKILLKNNNVDVNNNTVTIIVLDKTYNVDIKEGETVYDAMNNTQSFKNNNFFFKVKDYPSLGIFVDEINGIKGTPGKYWIYYVNDKEASVSISKYLIKNGDIIKWKQE